MYCSNCGKENTSNNFCVYCGAKLNPAAGSGSPYTAPPPPQNAPYYSAPPTRSAPYGAGAGDPFYVNGDPSVMGGRYGGPPQCAFDGTGGEYIGIWFLNILLILVTCGIAAPWVICRNLRWRKSHTIINGRRLAFTGTAGELFGKWIVWWLLTLVTCGIYSYWVSIKVREWEMSHTCYADLNPVQGAVYEDSFYDGMVGERVGCQLVANLLTLITCGIYRPWAVVKLTTYDMNHSVVNGDRLVFSGTGSGYWGESFIIGLLSAITCGIYAPWGVVRLNKWTYHNTAVISSGNRKSYY